MVRGLSSCTACGIVPGQGSILCLLRWQGGSLPLSRQGSPSLSCKNRRRVLRVEESTAVWSPGSLCKSTSVFAICSSRTCLGDCLPGHTDGRASHSEAWPSRLESGDEWCFGYYTVKKTGFFCTWERYHLPGAPGSYWSSL